MSVPGPVTLRQALEAATSLARDGLRCRYDTEMTGAAACLCALFGPEEVPDACEKRVYRAITGRLPVEDAIRALQGNRDHRRAARPVASRRQRGAGA